MRRVDALDGLRAIALLMVVVYHLDKAIFPAGHWGVMLFFVLSGYLITRTLCREIDETGRVDLRSFWSKRLLRLYPALALMCLVLVIFGLDWRRTLPSLGMYANYARIGGTDLGVLTHTWFVAVIAHFYLLWPVVMAWIPRHRRVAVIGTLFAVAVAWRVVAILVVSPGWVYNATDTDAAALLAGALLAVTRLRSWRHAWVALPLLGGATLLPVFGEEGAAFFWGGFVAIALSLLAVRYAIQGPQWLGTPVMGWIGEVSYGLYLWHYVFLQVGLGLIPTVTLSVALAALSYYRVEEPLLARISAWRRRVRRAAVRRERQGAPIP